MAFFNTVTRMPTWDKFNQITSVINAAGISEPATIEDETFDHWNKTHAINGTSVFLGCQFGVKAMKENGGSIVNFSSSFISGSSKAGKANSLDFRSGRLMGRSFTGIFAEISN